MAFLLLFDRLPSDGELRAFGRTIAEHRPLGATTLALLEQAAQRRAAPMQALRLGLASLVGEEPSAERLLGALPTIAASHARLLAGQAPLPADPSLSASESFLYGLFGQRPSARQARALDTYWNTVADHGLNASTFTARVITSTGGTLGAAVEGALGALERPLHG